MVIFGAMVIMTFNVSIGLFLASQTIAQIREAKSFSFNYKALQLKIMRALFAQVWISFLHIEINIFVEIRFTDTCSVSIRLHSLRMRTFVPVPQN